VGRAPARLDWDKLAFVNAHWLREADDARLGGLVAAALEKRGETVTEADRERLARAMPFLKTRAKTILELADQAEFLTLRRPLHVPEKQKAQLTEEALARLSRLRDALAQSASWADADLELLIQAFAHAEGVGLGKIGPAMRAVLVAGRPAPDLSKTLAALGREESLARLNDALPQRT
jgi:glutamyl-tRNA synthetase